jgi:hypothetical protein
MINFMVTKISMRFNALQCASMRFNALLAFLFCFGFNMWSQDCGNDFDLKKLRRDNPQSYQEFMRMEKLTEEYVKRMKGSSNQRLIDPNGLITIPIVIHVLHLGESIGTGTNISDARICLFPNPK